MKEEGRSTKLTASKQVTKTVTDKLLKEMEQNGLIKGKATKKDGGGQWVFWPIQVRTLPFPSPFSLLLTTTPI
jgi:hypothetical protein